MGKFSLLRKFTAVIAACSLSVSVLAVPSSAATAVLPTTLYSFRFEPVSSNWNSGNVENSDDPLGIKPKSLENSSITLRNMTVTYTDTTVSPSVKRPATIDEIISDYVLDGKFNIYNVTTDEKGNVIQGNKFNEQTSYNGFNYWEGRDYWEKSIFIFDSQSHATSAMSKLKAEEQRILNAQLGSINKDINDEIKYRNSSAYTKTLNADEKKGNNTEISKLNAVVTALKNFKYQDIDLFKGTNTEKNFIYSKISVYCYVTGTDTHWVSVNDMWVSGQNGTAVGINSADFPKFVDYDSKDTNRSWWRADSDRITTARSGVLNSDMFWFAGQMRADVEQAYVSSWSQFINSNAPAGVNPPNNKTDQPPVGIGNSSGNNNSNNGGNSSVTSDNASSNYYITGNDVFMINGTNAGTKESRGWSADNEYFDFGTGNFYSSSGGNRAFVPWTGTRYNPTDPGYVKGYEVIPDNLYEPAPYYPPTPHLVGMQVKYNTNNIPAALVSKARTVTRAIGSAQITVTASAGVGTAIGSIGVSFGTRYAGRTAMIYEAVNGSTLVKVASTKIASNGKASFSNMSAGNYIVLVK